ncbi:hypothetical protein ACX0G9_10110 [Flavitalea flava]
MPESFLTFQKFNDAGLASVIAERFKEQQIEYLIENEVPVFDVSFANNSIEPTIQLKVRPADFPRAHATLEAWYQTQLQDVDPDYYLLSFTDRELLDIVSKPDEWGHFDYALAKKLLTDRGIPITSDTANTLREKRLEELSKPERSSPNWILAGYFFAISGGLLGLFIGYFLCYFKKTLPNGGRVFVYAEPERKHGQRIMIISAISSAIWLSVLLFRGS